MVFQLDLPVFVNFSSAQLCISKTFSLYLQQPNPPQAASQPETNQNFYQNYDYSQSQDSYQQQAPPTQDFNKSQQTSQTFGQSHSAFKQPAPPPQAADQSAGMPQFFNPANFNSKPQMGGPSRLSRYGQGRPQYPK